MKPFIIPIPILLCLLLTSGLYGKTPPEFTSLKFRLIAWDSDIKDLSYFESPKSKKQVKIYSHTRSFFYNYKGSSIVSFFNGMTTNSNGELIPNIVASVNLSGAEKDQLLIFFNDPKEKGKYIIRALDDSADDFPFGSYKFCNFSNSKVGVELGGNKFLLEPRDITVQTGKPRLNGRAMNAKVWAQISHDKVGLIYTSSWAYKQSSRTIIFIAPDPNAPDGFVLKRIAELNPPPQK